MGLQAMAMLKRLESSKFGEMVRVRTTVLLSSGSMRQAAPQSLGLETSVKLDRV